MTQLLQQWLEKQFPSASRTTLRNMIKQGRVRINGRLARQFNQPVSPTDQIEIAQRKKIPPPPPQPKTILHPLKLIYEDDDLLVVDKPSGLLTSTVARERRPTALALVRNYMGSQNNQARDILIHRLDRDASGLLVFSKNDHAYQSLKQQFFKHTVERIYIAVTHGCPTPPAGRIESRLIELPTGIVHSTTRPGSGKLAVTEYQTLTREKNLAALRVTLHTGRKHQIRAQFAERKTPIVGDNLYNSPDDSPRLMLCAITLAFMHPSTSKPVRFSLTVPHQFPLVGGQNISLTTPPPHATTPGSNTAQ